jgi:hypothetical protein
MVRFLNARDWHKIESNKTGQSGFWMLTVLYRLQFLKHQQAAALFPCSLFLGQHWQKVTNKKLASWCFKVYSPFS